MRTVLVALSLLLLGGCSTVAYYTQTVTGQLGVMAATRPLDEVIDDPQTPPHIRQRLTQLARLRAFATDELGLPDNASYRGYAELQREAMVWSLVAAPRYDLQPRQWCYPVIGCASYRGYFDRADAQAHAARLADEGWDVAIEAVPAYSTLGWFDDPLPSTVIEWPLDAFAGLLFHELTHQRLYVAGDSDFNEAYATVVEREGVSRWLRVAGDDALRAAHAQRVLRQQQFLELVASTRSRLEALYVRDMADAQRAVDKAATFAALQDGYRRLRAGWSGYAGYDAWFDRALNNAHVAGIATYNRWEPALRELLSQHDGDFKAFHAACAALAKLPDEQRDRALKRLAEQAALRHAVGTSVEPPA
ncbi:MAG: aminopeptidase [Gammaproteobacteria bacterium]|nr:aminopeptidase [Gammaproteobacteria bacterium]